MKASGVKGHRWATETRRPFATSVKKIQVKTSSLHALCSIDGSQLQETNQPNVGPQLWKSSTTSFLHVLHIKVMTGKETQPKLSLESVVVLTGLRGHTSWVCPCRGPRPSSSCPCMCCRSRGEWSHWWYLWWPRGWRRCRSRGLYHWCVWLCRSDTA